MRSGMRSGARPHSAPLPLPLLVLLLLLPLAAPAGAWTLELEPTKSRVWFTFGATLHTVRGALAIEEGRFEVDPDTREASGRAVMDLTSASTGNGRRDRKMHAKILESARFPKAVFTLERLDGTIKPVGTSDLLLHGTLDFHGAHRQMLIPAQVRVEGERLTGRCHVTIPYIEWGLADPSFLLLRVAKSVDVTIEVTGRLTQ